MVVVEVFVAALKFDDEEGIVVDRNTSPNHRATKETNDRFPTGKLGLLEENIFSFWLYVRGSQTTPKEG